MIALAFLNVFGMNFRPCACVSQRLVWTPVLVLVFLSVCMDSCTCACVSECSRCGHLCLWLRFSVFLYQGCTSMLALILALMLASLVKTRV